MFKIWLVFSILCLQQSFAGPGVSTRPGDSITREYDRLFAELVKNEKEFKKFSGLAQRCLDARDKSFQEVSAACNNSSVDTFLSSVKGKMLKFKSDIDAQEAAVAKFHSENPDRLAEYLRANPNKHTRQDISAGLKILDARIDFAARGAELDSRVRELETEHKSVVDKLRAMTSSQALCSKLSACSARSAAVPARIQRQIREAEATDDSIDD